jgi:ATP-dependent protease ClpP protease subunit
MDWSFKVDKDKLFVRLDGFISYTIEDWILEQFNLGRGREIHFSINSHGGAVHTMEAICSKLEELQKKGATLHCHAEEVCQSAALCLLLCAPLENRTCGIDTEFMVHRCNGGSGNEILSGCAQVKLNEDIAFRIAIRTRSDLDTIRELMRREKTFHPEQALNEQIVGRVIDPVQEARKAKAAAKEEEVQQELKKQAFAKLSAQVGERMARLPAEQREEFLRQDQELAARQRANANRWGYPRTRPKHVCTNQWQTNAEGQHFFDGKLPAR